MRPIRLISRLSPIPKPTEGFIGIRYDRGKPIALFGDIVDGITVVGTQCRLSREIGKPFLYALTPETIITATPSFAGISVEDGHWCELVDAVTGVQHGA